MSFWRRRRQACGTGCCTGWGSSPASSVRAAAHARVARGKTQHSQRGKAHTREDLRSALTVGRVCASQRLGPRAVRAQLRDDKACRIDSGTCRCVRACVSPLRAGRAGHSRTHAGRGGAGLVLIVYTDLSNTVPAPGGPPDSPPSQAHPPPPPQRARTALAGLGRLAVPARPASAACLLLVPHTPPCRRGRRVGRAAGGGSPARTRWLDLRPLRVLKTGTHARAHTHATRLHTRLMVLRVLKAGLVCVCEGGRLVRWGRMGGGVWWWGRGSGWRGT